VPDNPRPASAPGSVRGDASTNAAEVDENPEWFSQFLNDRQTRKPSAHTMKAYRQDFIAIATLVTGGDPARVAVIDITKESMRTAFAAYARGHQAASIRRCWSTWNGAGGLASRRCGHAAVMAVTAFQDFSLADRDRKWDGDAAEKRVRKWAGAEDKPNPEYRDAHVWYDAENKDNFTAYKLLISDVVGGKLEAVPRGVMAAGAIMDGARGGIDLPKDDIDRVKSHLAKYYKKMGETAPWER